MSNNHPRSGALLSLRLPKPKLEQEPAPAPEPTRGFGGAGGKAGAKGRKRKGTGLSAADRGPLGKAPEVDAIKARGLLHLPLAGRISVGQVKAAYKKAAAEHHPDQGGDHSAMQRINAARDLLLGSSVE